MGVSEANVSVCLSLRVFYFKLSIWLKLDGLDALMGGLAGVTSIAEDT